MGVLRGLGQGVGVQGTKVEGAEVEGPVKWTEVEGA